MSFFYFMYNIGRLPGFEPKMLLPQPGLLSRSNTRHTKNIIKAKIKITRPAVGPAHLEDAGVDFRLLSSRLLVDSQLVELAESAGLSASLLSLEIGRFFIFL